MQIPFFFLNNTYSACISYSVTEKESHDIVRWYRMGKESKIQKHFPEVKWTFLSPSLLLKSVLIFEKTQYKNWRKPTKTTDPHIKIYILLQIVVLNSDSFDKLE